MEMYTASWSAHWRAARCCGMALWRCGVAWRRVALWRDVVALWRRQRSFVHTYMALQRYMATFMTRDTQYNTRILASVM